MTVTSVSSAQTYSSTGMNAEVKTRLDDFKALDAALQSGDLSGAQSAFAAFKKDLQNLSGQQSATGAGSKVSTDLDAIQSALQSGDVSSAQKAFDALKQDLGSVHKGRHHHHHHGGKKVDSTESSPTTSKTTDQVTAGTGINVIV